MTALDDSYAKAGYHARQDWGGRPALLLVDFASAYYVENSPLYAGEGAVIARDNAKRLVEAARARDVPVLWTEVRYLPGGADGGVFFRKTPALRVFERGNPLGDIVEGLDPRPDEPMITKQYPCAFHGTSLAATLTSMGVDTILLTGLSTSGCVRASCLGAMSNGFITLVVEDAVGDRAPEVHDANLFDMSAKYADLVTTDDAIAWLDQVKTPAGERTP
ncbi:MAG: isochorismatase family protein [Pseudomonadota bacterium]